MSLFCTFCLNTGYKKHLLGVSLSGIDHDMKLWH